MTHPDPNENLCAHCSASSLFTELERVEDRGQHGIVYFHQCVGGCKRECWLCEREADDLVDDDEFPGALRCADGTGCFDPALVDADGGLSEEVRAYDD